MVSYENSLNKRIDWIDYAKGIGIILIVMGHAGVPYITEYFGYAFHVPLFFFLSGLCFSVSKYNSFWEFFKKKCKTILLPYALFSVMWIALGVFRKTISGGITVGFVLAEFINYILQIRARAIWFLTVLFLTEIVMYFVIKKIQSKKRLMLVSIISAIIGCLYYSVIDVALIWNADVVFTALPFFIVGYCMKSSDVITEKLFRKENVHIWLVLVLVVNFLNVKILNNDLFIGMFEGEYGNFGLYYFAAFCGIFFTISASMQVNYSKILSYIGKNSIVFFACHQFVTTTADEIYEHFNLTESTNIKMLVLRIVVFFVALLFAAGVNEIIQRTPLCVFLGKKYVSRKKAVETAG